MHHEHAYVCFFASYQYARVGSKTVLRAYELLVRENIVTNCTFEEWMSRDIEDCVLEGDRECTFNTGELYNLTIVPATQVQSNFSSTYFMHEHFLALLLWPCWWVQKTWIQVGTGRGQAQHPVLVPCGWDPWGSQCHLRSTRARTARVLRWCYWSLLQHP